MVIGTSARTNIKLNFNGIHRYGPFQYSWVGGQEQMTFYAKFQPFKDLWNMQYAFHFASFLEDICTQGNLSSLETMGTGQTYS